jgi:hypothetical protein
MSNFSDFFPAAGGGGGFTKMNKYATERSGNDATHKLVSPATSFTVNPATDLGLSDGDSLGFFLVGAGYTTGSGTTGADGGYINQGTRIISNASTDLVLTIGVNGAASTISGGLTITSSDGSNRAGGRSYTDGGFATTWGQGINGYGSGSVGTYYAGATGHNGPRHGFGSGVAGSTSSDGAILLFY